MKLFDEVVGLIRILRSERGCPWDRAQTITSMKDDLREEMEEVIQAIEMGDMDNLCEELGDTLWSILLTVEIATDNGLFTLEDVLSRVKNKIINRHPHVFGDKVARTPEDALKLFYEAKKQEKEMKENVKK